ncbi:MAG TPA: phytoene/squalene synthase family protein [Terriglobales bacterium]|nr:phytoene/squalene synthase family protein [Terriglobales bacterium]
MTAALNELLRGTSRSFYLTLRVLPAAVRPQISLAYLLARTADTIADTDALPLDQRLAALREFREAILDSAPPHSFDSFAAQQASQAEKTLLQRPPEALAALSRLSQPDQQLIREVLSTIISGQELDLLRFGANKGGAGAALDTDAELDDYTYRVAGCVGEFWTRLCRAHLFPRAPLNDEQLIADGVRFGKGLQLVNVLRDLPADLANGRCYLPRESLRAAGLEPATLLAPENEAKFVPLYRGHLDIAEQHLSAGWRYTTTLPYGQFRVRLACAWPILIGLKTIQKLRASSVAQIRERVKISRGEVRAIVARSLLAAPFPLLWRRLA